MERIGKLGPPKGGWKVKAQAPGEPPTSAQIAVLRRHKLRVPATRAAARWAIARLKAAGWQR